jgi:hypothetical protein
MNTNKHEVETADRHGFILSLRGSEGRGNLQSWVFISSPRINTHRYEKIINWFDVPKKMVTLMDKSRRCVVFSGSGQILGMKYVIELKSRKGLQGADIGRIVEVLEID